MKAGIAEYDLKLGIGIDRFVPRIEYNIPSATMIQYGLGKMPMLFIIDSEGVITYFLSGFADLDKKLTDR